MYKERKPLLTVLFLLGALIFLRFVVFPPNALGSGETSILPTPKTFNLGEATVLTGSVPVVFADELTADHAETKNLAFLLGGRAAIVGGEPSF